MSKLLNAYSNYLARKPLQGNVVTAIVSEPVMPMRSYRKTANELVALIFT